MQTAWHSGLISSTATHCSSLIFANAISHAMWPSCMIMVYTISLSSFARRFSSFMSQLHSPAPTNRGGVRQVHTCPERKCRGVLRATPAYEEIAHLHCTECTIC